MSRFVKETRSQTTAPVPKVQATHLPRRIASRKLPERATRPGLGQTRIKGQGLVKEFDGLVGRVTGKQQNAPSGLKRRCYRLTDASRQRRDWQQIPGSKKEDSQGVYAVSSLTAALQPGAMGLNPIWHRDRPHGPDLTH